MDRQTNNTAPNNTAPLFSDLLKQDHARSVEQMKNEPDDFGFFNYRITNRCLTDASTMPIPENLYHSLIFEGELTILVADTNVGKSILAVQIADEIAKTNRKVLYLDLELSDIQFYQRYSENHQNPYTFNDNFGRAIFASNFSIPDGWTYDDYFIESLIKAVEGTGAKVIIIDNMTRLISTDTDSARSAKPMMDKLNELKQKHGLTLILLEHTRKTDGGRPISLNDLQGSKMKANFADAVFTIGRSARDKNIRYIKQLKARSSEVVYDIDNVIVYEIVKDFNFLHFKFLNYSSEWDHLKESSKDEKEDRTLKAKELYEGGMPKREIARQLGVSDTAVGKWVKINGWVQT